eukprot:GEMP01033080.1.p1 GENE.GEMP01033080.1~~GEMP01033080.1.p1  ORF type:complete len:345 (+),score=69.10 GEMP01033080.1:739-1773(+)
MQEPTKRQNVDGDAVPVAQTNPQIEDTLSEQVEEEPKAIIPPWHKICIVEGDEYKRKPEKVLLHTNGSVYRMRCEEVEGGKCLEIRIRGQFFLYNQIRIMVGTALAVSHKVLPLEIIPLALKTRIETHLPLAPPTGLCLCNAGFTKFDVRAGKCALTRDIWQRTFFGEPTLENVRDENRGYVLLSTSDAESSCEEFYVSRIRPAIMEGWKNQKWYDNCLAHVKWTPEVQKSIQADVDATLEKEKAVMESRREKERRRRHDMLEQAHQGYAETGGLPGQFPTALLCKFEAFPGPRFTSLQLAMCRRMGADEKWLDSTSVELLRLVEEVGLETLMEEGRNDVDAAL